MIQYGCCGPELAGSALKLDVLGGWLDTTWMPTHADQNPIILVPTRSIIDLSVLAKFEADFALADNYRFVSVTPVDCPVASGTQHPHGYAAILMAASVMEFPLTTLPVKFISVNARAFPSYSSVTWQIGEESNIDHYEVQRSFNGTDYSVIDKVLAAGRTMYVSQDDAPGNKTVYYRINAVSQDGTSY